MDTYPINLILKNRSCLVIGGGKIAYRKSLNMLKAGVKLSIVAPDFIAEFDDLFSDFDIEVSKRKFQNSDLSGHCLVVAATNLPALNSEIYDEVSKNPLVLFNSASCEAHCNFYLPAICNKDNLQISICTSGKTPKLAKAIRKYISKLLANIDSADLENLIELRSAYKQDKTKHNLSAMDTIIAKVLTALNK